MEAQEIQVVCTGLTGSHSGCAASYLCVNHWGSDDGGQRLGSSRGRQTACPGILPLWPASESVGRDQAEGIFQLDQLVSRNRIKWERGMFRSGLESPGGFFDLPIRPIHASGRAVRGPDLDGTVSGPGGAQKCQGSRSRGLWLALPLIPLRALCRPPSNSDPVFSGEARGWE